MAVKPKRESTNEIASPKKIDTNVNPKDFTRGQAQANISINIEFNLIERSFTFYFTDSKMEKQINYDYYHWGANKKVMDFNNKCEKRPETLRLIEKRTKITKPANLPFKLDSGSNRKMCVQQRPDKRGMNEVTPIDIEFFSGNMKKSRWGGYFEFKETKPASTKGKPSTREQNTIEPKPVSSTEENELMKSSSNFPIVDLKDYDIAEKTIHYIQINHVIDKPKTKCAEAEENLKKPSLNS